MEDPAAVPQYAASLRGVRDAAERIASHAHLTPVCPPFHQPCFQLVLDLYVSLPDNSAAFTTPSTSNQSPIIREGSSLRSIYYFVP